MIHITTVAMLISVVIAATGVGLLRWKRQLQARERKRLDDQHAAFLEKERQRLKTNTAHFMKILSN